MCGVEVLARGTGGRTPRASARGPLRTNRHSDRVLLSAAVDQWRRSTICLHRFNAVLLPSHGWYRVDARGNKVCADGSRVDAQFTPDVERLAFPIQFAGEATFPRFLQSRCPSWLRRFADTRQCQKCMRSCRIKSPALVRRNTPKFHWAIAQRTVNPRDAGSGALWRENLSGECRISRRKTALDPLGTRPYLRPVTTNDTWEAIGASRRECELVLVKCLH